MADQSGSPFSDADIQSLLEEERHNDQVSGWKMVHKTDLVETWRKSDHDHPVHLIKGFIKFPGIPVDAVAELVTNIELRKKWDKETFPLIEVIEKHDDYLTVHWQCKMPVGVTDREMLQYMWVKKDESNNTTFVIFKDAQHQDVPETKHFIRTETLFSGLIIRPDPDDANSAKMTLLIQNDAKGLLPKVVVNHVTTKAPEEWRATLHKYYTEVYSVNSS